MNKKILVILAGIGVWFLIVAVVGFYYLMIGTSNQSDTQLNNKENQIKANEKIPKSIVSNTEQSKNSSIENDDIKTEPAKKEIYIDPNSISIDKLGKSNDIFKEIEAEPKKEPEQLKLNSEKNTEAEKNEEIIGGINIRGHVIDLKTNLAIEGVSVDFYTGDGIFLRNCKTDKNGFFEIKVAKAPAIHVRLYKEKYIKVVYKQYSISELQEHLLFKLDPGFVLSGIIRDKSTSLPVVGVNVDLYRGNLILKKGDVSNGEGRFSVDAVPLGTVELIFSKLGFSQASQIVNVENNNHPNLEIFLEKSSSLTIEVIVAGSFVPIPKIKVYFEDNLEARTYERSILGEDQNKNIFRILGIDRKYSKLRIHADGYTYPPEKQIEVNSGQEAKVVFEVDKGITINGTVRGVDGKFLSNVNINVFEVFGGGRAHGDDVQKGSVITDANGKFSLSGISIGNIEIITNSTVYKRFQKKYTISEANNPEIEIELEIESFFDGTVTDTDNKPVAISEVRFVPIKSDGVYDNKRDRPVFEGSKGLGDFKMSGVRPGLYRLSITANGYIAYIVERYEVKEGQITDSYKMTKGISITGELKSELGAPIVDAEVRVLVTMKESNVKYKSNSDYNGFFAINGLEEDIKYKMQIQGKGYQLFEKEINLKEGQNHYPITLVKKMSFSGVVVDANTQLPIQKFQIKIYGKLSQNIVDDSTEDFNTSNGQFFIPVNSEVFNVEIKANGYSIYFLKDVKITDPVKKHFMAKAGSLNIKLTAGKDPASMKAILISRTKDIETDEEKRVVRTDSNGNVIVQNLMPGSYFVRVSNIDGYANSDSLVTITEEVETQLKIVLIPGFLLKGRLLSESTLIPITSGQVFLNHDQYTKYPQKSYLNGDGFFEIKNVSPGNHSLTVNYGPIADGKFSKNFVVQIVVPERVNNGLGVYQIPDVLVK